MPLDRIEIFLSEYNCSFLNLESTDTTMEKKSPEKDPRWAVLDQLKFDKDNSD